MALMHKSEVAQRFSKAAMQYDQFAGVQHKLASLALDSVPKIDGIALDIGCATGAHTRRLPAQTIGLDVALGMLHVANKHNNTSTAWVNADMDALPFNTQCFAHVFSSMALQWTQSVDGVLTEIYRVLSKQGTARLLMPVHGAFYQLVQAYESAGLVSKINALHSKTVWCEAAKQAGFAKVAGEIVTQVDRHHDIFGLLGSISRIGASTSSHAEHGPLTRNDISQLSHHYPKHEQMFELDYRCLLLSLEK